MNLILLELCSLSEMFPVQINHETRSILNNFRKLLRVEFLVDHYLDQLLYDLVNDDFPGLRDAQVITDRFFSQFLH